MLPKIAQSIQKHQIVWIIAVAAFISLNKTCWQGFYWGVGEGPNSFNGIVINGDTASYVRASLELPMYLRGEVDVQRTPVYPLFLALCRTIAGEQYYLFLVVFFQYFLSWIAVYVFYQTCNLLFKTKTAIFSATAAFIGFRYVILDMNNSVSSESMSVSFIVFFFYGITSYLYKPVRWKAVAVGLSLFIAIMLRPAFLLFVPIILLLWIALLLQRSKNEPDTVNFKSSAVYGFLATLLSIVLLLSYSYGVYKKCGVFNVTCIGAFNHLCCTVLAGIFDNGSVPEINDRISTLVDQWREKTDHQKTKNSELWKYQKWGDLSTPLGYVLYSYPVPKLWNGADIDERGIVTTNSEAKILQYANDTFPINEMQRYAQQTIMRNKYAYAQFVLKKIYLNLYLNPVYWLTAYIGTVLSFIVFCFSLCSSVQRSTDKEQITLHGLLLLFIGSTVFTVFSSAMDTHERLCLPVIALWIFTVFIAVDRLFLFFQRKNVQENVN
ncbi:hypothetical protein FACS189419_05350 [Planctomycetales bacterium]|nr:hypothetical protein FACS189419_05350 [Planctomycetales bacterium]